MTGHASVNRVYHYRHPRDGRYVVEAPSRAAAARAFGITYHEAKGFMGETANARDIELARSAHGQVVLLMPDVLRLLDEDLRG